MSKNFEKHDDYDEDAGYDGETNVSKNRDTIAIELCFNFKFCNGGNFSDKLVLFSRIKN